MKKGLFTSILSICLTVFVTAQENVWTMEACMQYAISNSPAVRKKSYEQDINKAEYTSAIANFFPSLDIGANARYNYGRSIDPETNTYKETTTFNNYYNGEASLPLFNGGQLINQWRTAKLNRQSGMNAIQKAKDDLALQVMQAYIDVIYYKELMYYTTDKLEESKKNLYRSQRLVELGLKGKADLAQIEAEVANDDYLCTHQQNRYNMALSTLKEYMNYPIGEVLKVGTMNIDPAYQPFKESVDDIYGYAQENNPTALQAGYELRNSELQHLIQKGKLFPAISFYAGVNTSYFENLKSDIAPKSFNTQFKNNMGEYFGVSVRIPLFNRLNTVTEVRRARNNVRIAEETQSEILRQLQTAIEKAVLDKEGYAKEVAQMEKKLQAEEYSYQVTSRKYEEGLMSSLDLRTSANLLLESQANLLHRKLMYLLKCKEVEYYKGVPLIIEN